MDFVLRPETPHDQAFLFDLFAQTHGAPLAALPAPLRRMQFEAQRAHYRAAYPNATNEIILRDGAPAGRLCADRGPDTIRLIDIALIPAHRGQGLGSAVLESLRQSCGELTLSVQHGNPARRLYERLGFTVCRDNGLYLDMQWRATRHGARH